MTTQKKAQIIYTWYIYASTRFPIVNNLHPAIMNHIIKVGYGSDEDRNFLLNGILGRYLKDQIDQVYNEIIKRSGNSKVLQDIISNANV